MGRKSREKRERREREANSPVSRLLGELSTDTVFPVLRDRCHDVDILEETHHPFDGLEAFVAPMERSCAGDGFLRSRWSAVRERA